MGEKPHCSRLLQISEVPGCNPSSPSQMYAAQGISISWWAAARERKTHSQLKLQETCPQPSLLVVPQGKCQFSHSFKRRHRENAREKENEKEKHSLADILLEASRTYCTPSWGCPPWQLRISNLKWEIQKHCRKHNRETKSILVS